MDLKITLLDGRSYTLGEYDVIVKDIIIGAMDIETNEKQIQGLHGIFDGGITYKGRSIRVPFTFIADSLAAYPLYRDLVYDIVMTEEPFYIQEMRRPQELQYEFKDTVGGKNALTIDQYGNESPYDSVQVENEVSTGKRYLVRLTGCKELDQKGTKGVGELEFYTAELPFAESIGTSLDLERDGLHYADNPIWSYGMGLSRDSSKHQYTFDLTKGTTFDVYNFGNVPINQFNQHFIIKLEFLDDMSSVMRFGFNQMNIEIDGKKAHIKKGDIVTYETSSYFNSGLSILHATNYAIPELQTGLNKLMFERTWKVKASIEIKYYYK